MSTGGSVNPTRMIEVPEGSLVLDLPDGFAVLNLDNGLVALEPVTEATNEAGEPCWRLPYLVAHMGTAGIEILENDALLPRNVWATAAAAEAGFHRWLRQQWPNQRFVVVSPEPFADRDSMRRVLEAASGMTTAAEQEP
jgi:hypothetical protein